MITALVSCLSRVVCQVHPVSYGGRQVMNFVLWEADLLLGCVNFNAQKSKCHCGPLGLLWDDWNPSSVHNARVVVSAWPQSGWSGGRRTRKASK